MMAVYGQYFELLTRAGNFLARLRRLLLALGNVIITRATDALGRSSGFSLEEDYVVSYAYDAYGRFHSISSSVSSASLAVQYAYLPGSDLISGMTASGGHAWTRSYEPQRNLISAVENRHGETVISRFDYENDEIGRRVARLDSGSAFGGVVTNTFGYNVRSELASAFMGTNRFGYVFDPIGNRTVATNNAELLTYLANELNQYTNITDGVTLEPTYDSDGNMTWDGRFSYTWDAGNRLVAAYSNSVCIVANAYDHMSRRVRKVTPYAAHTFVYDGWNLVQEVIYTASGENTNRYVWGKDLSGTLQGAGGIGGLLSASLDGTTAHYCYDANGNVGQLIGTNGDLLAHYEYSPFGEIIVSSGLLAEANPFRFSTKWFDKDTRLSYYCYRYYLPVLGKLLSQDCLSDYAFLAWFSAGKSRRERQRLFNLSLRPLYPIVENNPVNMIDPVGLYGRGCPDSREKCACLFACGKSRCEQGASLASQALQEAQKRYPDSLHNGNGDAWRHCHWSCKMVRELGRECAKKNRGQS